MEKDLECIKDSCLEKWYNGQPGIDERLQNFDEKFVSWIEQIPIKNRPTVITLIENLEYYSHRTVNLWLEKLHIKLLASSDINDDNTIYAFIKSNDGQTNSSNDYWTEYKAINKLNKHICIEDMSRLEPEDWGQINNIVFIDDFSGSGRSFITELKKCPERYKNKNVYFITINTMILAIDKINKYCMDNNINIVLLSAFNQEKAFEQNIFENDEKAKNDIIQMSKDLQIPSDHILGFNKTQALAVFYNNTPNNTLGFIRYNTTTYKSIFPRKEDYVPKWAEMKKERKRRERANYNNKVSEIK